MKFIGNLREGDRTVDIYLCKQKQTLRSKSGKNYFSMILQDKTGTIDAKIWDLSNGINHFDAMDYIQVEGEVTSYQGSLQLNVRRVRVAAENEYDPADYLPCSRFSINDMYRELLGYMDSLSNPKMKVLVRSMVDFANEADLKSCLEGVEDEKLQNYLRSFGATWFQGYYYSRPVQAAAMKKLLNMEN